MNNRKLEQPTKGKGSPERLARALRENLKRRKLQAVRRGGNRRLETAPSQQKER